MFQIELIQIQLELQIEPIQMIQIELIQIECFTIPYSNRKCTIPYSNRMLEEVMVEVLFH